MTPATESATILIMMEWRLGLALGVCCAIATAVGCTGSEGTGDDDDGGDVATPSAGTAGTPGSSSGGSSAGVGGAASAGTSTGAPGGTGGTGGAVGAQCVDSELPLCVDDTNIRACIDGAYETLSCPDFCENAIYFEPGPCNATTNDCDCGEPLNPTCAQGVTALCRCLQEVDEPCTDLEAFGLYIACYEGDADLEPVLTCFGESTTSPPDCAALANQCIPDIPTAGAGGTGGSGAAGGMGGTGGAAP